ncbi:low-density lipoprotein receptor-related protein 3-like [Dreissena polymorpha]|uniref:CUB domain-containing protein n=1 Tax=Dreissena polymorpha TaxID=45954 RepID=A0A9D4MYX3_DREPO|nr:low-density lipoprotein receptor-related protein 3-like [Dreissena polymorpha]KAH3884274.1 hypothetical protein DPMN_008252 [Dreissena polymorpha]
MQIPVLMFLALLVGQSSAIINYYLESYCNGYSWPIDMSILDTVRLRLTSSLRYNNNMNCSVSLTTSSSKQLMYYFRSFDVENSDSCQYDFLEMHDGTSLRAPYANGFYGKQCGSYVDPFVYTTSNSALTLWFKSDNSNTGKGFDMIITSYHTGICDPDEYSCSNGRCVENYLTCNGYNPCGDHSDCALTVGGIAGIAVGSVC